MPRDSTITTTTSSSSRQQDCGCGQGQMLWGTRFSVLVPQDVLSLARSHFLSRVYPLVFNHTLVRTRCLCDLSLALSLCPSAFRAHARALSLLCILSLSRSLSCSLSFHLSLPCDRLSLSPSPQVCEVCARASTSLRKTEQKCSNNTSTPKNHHT